MCFFTYLFQKTSIFGYTKMGGAICTSHQIDLSKLIPLLCRGQENSFQRGVKWTRKKLPIIAEVVCRLHNYEDPREIFLFFYYPADEYISYLMTVDELEFYDEIECDELFEGNDPREQVMIFQLPDYED